jgi:prepilin-type N-terminal cleavage/methylation domain-containing protein
MCADGSPSQSGLEFDGAFPSLPKAFGPKSRRFSPSPRGRNGFTLTEVVVVIGIVLLIVSMAFPILSASRNRGRTVRCLSNLRNLTVALQLYAQRSSTYPPQGADLMAALGSQAMAPEVFKCPDDETEDPDSYSDFYIGRREQDEPTSLVLACPRHFGFEKSLNLFLDTSESIGDLLVIRKKTAGETEEIPAGEVVTDGDLLFGGGVKADVRSGHPALRPITAYKKKDGWMHVVLRVTGESEGRIAVTSAARHVVEVVTHAGVTEARESDVVVTVTRAAESRPGLAASRPVVAGAMRSITEVAVTAGSARLTPTAGAYVQRLPGGFELSPQSDSAYEPVSIPAGESAVAVRPE